MNKIVILTALYLFFVQPCFAKTDVPYLQGRVNDYANILSDSTAKQIEKQLQTYETETTNQIVVLTVDSLNGQDIESYASEVFSAWKPGQAGKDNGVLLVVAVKDRKMRIEVGYGLEGSITDTKSGLVIRNAIAPYFKQGNFDRGIDAGVEALMQLGRGIEPTSAVSSEKPGGHSFGFIAVLVMPFIIIVIMALLIIKKYLRSRPRVSKKTGMAMKKLDETADDAYLSKGQQYEEAIGSVDYDVWVTGEGDDVQIIPHKKWFTEYTSCPKCLFKTYYEKSNVTLKRASYSHSGYGEKTYVCRNCKFENQVTYTIPKLKRDAPTGFILLSGGSKSSDGWFSGGGFSGGGGSSGGGGASGGW
jgi:uncharacterized protein